MRADRWDGRAACLALAVGVFPAPTFAGPPYATDDPVPTERGQWEIYQYASASRAGNATGGEAGFDLNYGAGPQLQLTLVVPAAWDHADGTRITMGTVQAAAKYRIVRQADGAAVEIAVFPRAFLPTAANDSVPKHVAVLLPVWIGHESGPWYAFAGGGYEVNPGHGQRNFWTGGAALTRSFRDELSMGAEIYGRTADADHAQSFVGLNLGLAWSLSPHWSLLASGGPGIVHAHDEGQYAFYAALQSVY